VSDGIDGFKPSLDRDNIEGWYLGLSEEGDGRADAREDNRCDTHCGGLQRL
jgi:hypothetical protein